MCYVLEIISVCQALSQTIVRYQCMNSMDDIQDLDENLDEILFNFLRRPGRTDSQYQTDPRVTAFAGAEYNSRVSTYCYKHPNRVYRTAEVNKITLVKILSLSSRIKLSIIKCIQPQFPRLTPVNALITWKVLSNICQFYVGNGVPLSCTSRNTVGTIAKSDNPDTNYLEFYEEIIDHIPILTAETTVTQVYCQLNVPFTKYFVFDRNNAWENIEALFKDSKACTYVKPGHNPSY